MTAQWLTPAYVHLNLRTPSSTELIDRSLVPLAPYHLRAARYGLYEPGRRHPHSVGLFAPTYGPARCRPSVRRGNHHTPKSDATNRLWSWFHDVNANRSGEITIVELRTFLFFSRSMMINDRAWGLIVCRHVCSMCRTGVGQWGLEACVSLSRFFSQWMGGDDAIWFLAFDLDTIKLLMQLFVRDR